MPCLKDDNLPNGLRQLLRIETPFIPHPYRMMSVSRLSHLLSQTFVQNTTGGQQQSTAGIFNQFQSRPNKASDEAQPCERPSEQRFFSHDERSSKELDIRNAKCAPHLKGESSRKPF